jgi:son of sevenless-like protein
VDLRSVDVPSGMGENFLKAEKLVEKFFGHIDKNVEKGEIIIGESRYMFIQARAMAVYIRKSLQDILGVEGANRLLYRIGKELGKADARTFHEKFKLNDAMDRLAVGPVYFAHGGWAFVQLLKPSKPTPDDDYLLYFNHPNSFEATEIIKEGLEVFGCVCHINAGYSAGWCQESFRIPLDTKELTCIANGEDECKFIMTVGSKLDFVVNNWRELRTNGEEITVEGLFNGLPGYK